MCMKCSLQWLCWKKPFWLGTDMLGLSLNFADQTEWIQPNVSTTIQLSSAVACTNQKSDLFIRYVTQITYIFPQTLRVGFLQVAVWQYADCPHGCIYKTEDFCGWTQALAAKAVSLQSRSEADIECQGCPHSQPFSICQSHSIFPLQTLDTL